MKRFEARARVLAAHKRAGVLKGVADASHFDVKRNPV
jgi:hypothetical protein